MSTFPLVGRAEVPRMLLRRKIAVAVENCMIALDRTVDLFWLFVTLE